MPKQKRSSVPDGSSSKARGRSGNPAVRAGEAEPAPRAKSQSVESPKQPKPPPQVVERAALPPDGASYPQILRGESYAWWRSVLGVVVGLSLFSLITSVVSQALVTVFWATTAGSQSYLDYYTKAFAFELPIGMLSVNLGFAALIPVVWGLMAAIHHMQPRWLSSVRPRIRWGYLFACLAIAAVVLNGVMLLSTTVGEPLSIRPQEGFWPFLAVIVLTSPIQAAAEEILFRGYLLQALGSLVSRPWSAWLHRGSLPDPEPAAVRGPAGLRAAGWALGVAYRRTGSRHCRSCHQQRVRLHVRRIDELGSHNQAAQGNHLGRCRVRCRWFRALCSSRVRPVTADEAAQPRPAHLRRIVPALLRQAVWGRNSTYSKVCPCARAGVSHLAGGLFGV